MHGIQGSALGAIGGGQATPRPETLNDRLNNVAGQLAGLGHRLTAVLNRVNGTPPTPQEVQGKSATQTQLPMTSAVESIECHVNALRDMIDGVERIA